jgi:hypothetical protein
MRQGPGSQSALSLRSFPSELSHICTVFVFMSVLNCSSNYIFPSVSIPNLWVSLCRFSIIFKLDTQELG